MAKPTIDDLLGFFKHLATDPKVLEQRKKEMDDHAKKLIKEHLDCLRSVEITADSIRKIQNDHAKLQCMVNHMHLCVEVIKSLEKVREIWPEMLEEYRYHSPRDIC